VNPERIRILYPGVDTARYSPDTRQPTSNSQHPTLLSVSRLAELYKGHDAAIRALPLVRAKVPGARYLIAGDGPLRAYLGKIAASVGVTDAVHFLGDVPDDALPDLYRSADLLLLLGRDSLVEGGAEGFGIVCLEAAACGIPVVAGRSGGLPDAVADGITGLLVDPHDAGAAAEAIVALLADPERAHRLGATGRARVLERFTWEQMATEARRIFGEAVERR
jgi:phosphatidylinositol alpha-1,6-mannosyltransferase